MPEEFYWSLTGKKNLKKEYFIPPKPEELGPDEIYAETIWSAISPGTELAAWKELAPLRPSRLYPRLMGYANIARIKAVGKEVTKAFPGNIILTHHSHRSALTAVESDILLSFDGADDEVLPYTTTYFYHLGYYPYLKSEVVGFQNVAVIGLGMIGLCAAQLGRQMGHHVAGFSNNVCDQLFRKVAGDNLFAKDSAERYLEVTAETTGISGADLVILTTNSWDDWRLALQVVRNGGKIAVIGFPGRENSQVPMNPLASEYFYDKQINIISCANPPDLDCAPVELRHVLKRNCKALANHILTGKLEPEFMIGHIESALELPRIYESLETLKRDHVSVILDWRR